MLYALAHCLLFGAWHQNIGEKALKWQMKQTKIESS